MKKREIKDSIAEIIKQHGITDYEFAYELGVSPSTVSTWKSGKRQPNFKYRDLICKKYKVDMNYLSGLTTVQQSTEIINNDGISVTLYDKKALENIRNLDLKSISESKQIAGMVLPGFMFNKDDEYFALTIEDNSLKNYDVNTDDIAIFKVIKNKIDNNSLVLAVENKKLKFFKYKGENKSPILGQLVYSISKK